MKHRGWLTLCNTEQQALYFEIHLANLQRDERSMFSYLRPTSYILYDVLAHEWISIWKHRTIPVRINQTINIDDHEKLNSAEILEELGSKTVFLNVTHFWFHLNNAMSKWNVRGISTLRLKYNGKYTEGLLKNHLGYYILTLYITSTVDKLSMSVTGVLLVSSICSRG